MIEKLMQKHVDAMNETIDKDQVREIHDKQQEIVDAFRAQHGLDPLDVGVEVRNYGQGRVVWMVRKLSKSEREWRTQQCINKDVAAMAANASKRAKVFAYVADLRRVPRWMFWLRRTFSPAAVFLSERGARQEGGESCLVYDMEVKA